MSTIFKWLRSLLGLAVNTVEAVTNPDDLLTQEAEKALAPKKDRKVRDTTKLTQADYDTIIARYELLLAHNEVPGNKREYIKDIIDDLNRQLGMNKSPRVYYRVIQGKVSREDLPVERS